MPPSDSPAERTLTGMLAPHPSRGEGRHAVLLVAARAGTAWVSPSVRVVPVGTALELGRRGVASSPGTFALDDALASGRHARIAREGDDWVLTDLGSKNGTFVDGERIAAPRTLEGGECLFVGAHVLVFRLATPNELEAMREELGAPLGPVPTTSPRLASVCSKLRRLAPSPAEILLAGETGVGKEVYARAIHATSGRAGRFVAINCAAIPRELVESELFGYRPGAHSTASSSKPGLLEEADGGTLFLDEIGEMAIEAQTKLLRFLQERELTPLGATRPRKLDVRVLAATNRAVGRGGALRDDLLARLGATPFVLPPLRERIEDLGPLVDHLLARTGPPRGVEDAALRAMALHDWPLNVRELDKLLVAAAALAGPGRSMGLAHLPEAWLEAEEDDDQDDGSTSGPTGVASPAPPRVGRKPPEPPPSAEVLERLLGEHRGNVAEVARALGRQRAAVWRWIKRFGLPPERFRG